MVDSQAILEVQGISKSFGGPPVLEDVSLQVGVNQIVGIVGENGAGKSTLFNIISGILKADRGRIILRGKEIRPANYREATLLGISRVFQEQALIPNIAVYENLLLAHEGLFTRWGQWVDRRRMIETAERIVAAIGLDIDVRRRTGDFDFSKRQSIEIARACLAPQEVLNIEYPIVLLDEPTSSLQKMEEQAFFKLIGRLREHGSVVFISHRLSEVLAVSDVIYVMKDGRLVATVDPASANERTLHGLMVGRERDADYYHEVAQERVDERPVVFRTNGLSKHDAYQGVSLQAREGEVLGIGGLLESGKSRFGRGAAGLVLSDSGTVQFGNEIEMKPDFRRLILLGLGYVPAERSTEGIIPSFSVAWNTSTASGNDIFSSVLGIWRTGLEFTVTHRYMEQLRVRAGGPNALCGTLSGGNQQKVVLARWLCREPKLLILDNPTRGVDAGAKEEIYALIRRLTARGVGIILITDELLELIGLSNRIAIMRHGRVAEIVEAPAEAKPTERELLSIMLGGSGRASVADAKLKGAPSRVAKTVLPATIGS